MPKNCRPKRITQLLAKILIAGSVFLCSGGNALAALTINKTIVAPTLQPAAESAFVYYNIEVTNTGPGPLTNVVIDDVLGVDLSNLVFQNSPLGGSQTGPAQYTIPNMAAAQSATLTIRAEVNSTRTCPIIENSSDVSESSATYTASDAAPDIEYDFEFTSGTTSNVIRHLSTSFCEFCGTGEIRISITNPTTTPLTNIVLREDLQALGLSYINNSTRIGIGTGGPLRGDPTPTGTALTWDSGDIVELTSLAAGATLNITFEVSIFDEAQMQANPIRDVIADATFETACTAGTHNVNSGLFNLPLEQPTPQVGKWGRNYDANQNNWQSPVWGSFNDDIIWRVRVRNLGDAYIEALRINDSITGSNFSINYICPTLADANDVGFNNGVAPGASPCIAMTSPFNVVDPFGSAADPQDIGFSGSPDSRDGNFYYVGRVLNNHTDETNTADVSWGCAAESATGGLITTTASGAAGGLDVNGSANLETSVTTNGLQVTQTVTGTNTAQNLGTRGIVTITLNNQTGGSIQNLEVTASLPNGYVVDNTFGLGAGLTVGDPNYGQPNSTETGAFGTYAGFIDTVTRDDATLLTADPLDDLNPHFTLTSTTTGADAAQQDDMMREDDVITIRFGIILVDPTRFDKVADLDVTTENTADGTDPSGALTLSNTVTVDFDAVDPAGAQNQQRIVNFNAINANPEDLDIDISDALFILTNNPGNPLDLNVIVTNNGGHDADNYTVYVTLGQAMTVQGISQAGCLVASNPPIHPYITSPHPLWNDPSSIPGTAAVYACDLGVIAPGAANEETITFSVIKSAGAVDDDLTFRADVIGEIHYADSTGVTPHPLVNPAPASIPSTTPNQQLVNNYTLDAVRSRVLGFNLVQSPWYCAEDGVIEPAPPTDIITPLPAPPNLPVMAGNLNTQIGEDCALRIEAGGWFGFGTPGFSLIEVNNVDVIADLPDNLPSVTNEGQGFIPFGGSPYNINVTTPAIELLGGPGSSAGATTTPLDNNDITWQFNNVNGIIDKDKFFRVDYKVRLLNDPVDGLYPVPGTYTPNLHGNTSTIISRASFTAVFDNTAGGTVSFNVQDNNLTPGYPDISDRTTDQIEVEPNLIVTKQVCNETLSIDSNPLASGASCTPFLDAVNNGDTNDNYVYRIILTNETTAPVRSPAFNVVSTDILDASDLMLVLDFETDGLDNDGDNVADGADAANEAALFASIPDNTIGTGTPAKITVTELFNANLARVDSGTSITFYYRVDPDITIAPLQTLTNTVDMSYDSLDVDSGNQSVPQYTNAENTAPTNGGRARIYNSITQTADVTMIPLVAQPIAVIAKSNTPMNAPPFPPATPEEVSVGEEIRYQMVAELPVANLRQFRIRNALPQGLSCIELQAVTLNTLDFFPGGPPLTTTCTQSTGAGSDVVEWFFGDQAVISSPPGNRLLFPINFVARVENTAFTGQPQTITNGGTAVTPATCSAAGSTAAVCYKNDAGTDVALNFQEVDVLVREPVITLTKSFAPVVNSDAGDILTVTVTAENTVVTDNAGAGAAYNLQILDDLSLTDLTYINDSMLGVDAPDDDGVAADSKLPIFSWLPASSDYEILTGVANLKTFTFKVRVDTTAQPLEILDNTIQAKWDSLPGQTTALNVSGSIGADGSATGLRNGLIPNPTVPDTLNDYVTTASDSTVVLPLTLDKTIEPPAVVNTIGAHKNFQIVITLPEGTTNDLVVTDVLNTSGLSYVLSRNASYDITYTFNDIVSINTFVPDEAVFRGATVLPSPTLPVDGDSDLLTWDIGTVVTAEEIDPGAGAVNPSITINYFARVNNDTDTDAGDTLQNSATVTYDHGETAAEETLNDTTAVQTVVEPLLEFLPAGAGVTVTNQTAGKAPTDLPDSGDTLEYKITLINNGTSEAFDTNIVATLPATGELEFDASVPSAPTATVNGVAVPLFTAVPAGGLTGPLVWGKNNADNTLDVPDGETLVLTYRVIVQTITEPNTALATAVTADWTSLEDNDPSLLFERTGAGCPTITAPDDYCTTESDTINTIDDNSIVKSIVFDTYAVAPGTALDSIVRIGDTVTYRLEVNIQEGTTDSVKVVDTLPAGMTFVDVISINGDAVADYDPPALGAGSNFSYTTITAGNYPAVGATGALTWNFGTVSNDAAGDATTDTIVIEYRARVTEDAGIPHQDTTTLSNTADLTYIDGNNLASPAPASTPRLRSIADLTVLQPIMDALTKSDRDGDPVNNDPVNVATDIINYRLHTCNTTGLAPAYGLLVTDSLPTEYDEGSITSPVVTIGGVLASEGAANDYVYTPPVMRGGDMIFTFATPVNPGACVDIDFDIGFYTDFGFGAFANSVTVNEYYSLPPANAQLYGPVGPVLFNLNNPATAFVPPVKAKTSADDAAVGDEVVYTITVPGAASGASIYDVTVADNLDASLIFVSATDISANAFTLTDATTVANQLRFVIANIPAGQQAIIELRARVDNNASADASVSFNNSSSYTYAAAPAGATINVPGSGTTVTPLNIVEPALTSSVTASNISNPGVLPVAGDIIEINATLNASGGAPGDNFSDAFDVSYNETLDLGLVYAASSATITGVATALLEPVIVAGDGIGTPQSLRWSLEDANADIDIPEGNIIPVVITYQLIVLDNVQSNQPLNNNVRIEWTSRNDAGVVQDVNERDGSETPVVNDYFINDAVAPGPTTVSNDTNIIAKLRLTDTYAGAIANTVRIGDVVEYELRLTVQPGTHPNVVVADTLPTGLAFQEIVSINGDTAPSYAPPPSGAGSNFVYTPMTAANVVVTGDPVLAPSTVKWNIGQLINQSAGDATTDDFVIVYRARVLNLVHPQTPTTFALINNVSFNFDTFTGAEAQLSSATISMLQPDLAITKTAIPTGGVTVTDPLNTIIDAGEFIDYTIEIFNSGDAIAYDVVLQDAIPVGLRNGAAPITVTSTQLVIAGTILTNLAPAYNSATGIAVWDFDNGGANTYNIPPGDTLRMVYRVQADAALGAGLTMTNSAQVMLYYSFDDEAVPVLGGVTGVREIYNPSNISQVTLTTAAPNALLKTNPVPPADLNASIGETITYTILVPGVIQTTALHDVQIIDDLGLSAADLAFVSVSKVSAGGSWTPTNIGTSTNIIIADSTIGIDIPANQQIEIALTVIVRNPPPPALPVINVSGLTFDNTATYTFNQVNDDAATVSAGAGNTTPVMMVVEPELTLTKSGPGTTVSFGVPIPYTLVIDNAGNGPAFDITIIDRLPNAAAGGTCDVAPINFNARITTDVDELTTVRALVAAVDYSATFTAAPACELVITAITPAARIEADEKFIISYDAALDSASQSGAALTNVAGVTRWFSLDTAAGVATGEIREYTRTINDAATAAAVLDHEDAVTVTVEAPTVDVQKTVFNVTTGIVTTPTEASVATPGDTLRYTVIVTNSGDIDATNVTITDAIPLNATYVTDSVFLNGLPVNQPDGGISPLTAGIDVSSSDLAPPTSGNGTITVGQIATIRFDVLLNAAITSGTVISNQALVDSPATGALPSDDPNISGLDDPNVIGDEDPTITTITSAPAFQVQKTSLDVTADPAVLNPGDTLRYTLTVKNIGQEDGVNVLLRDVIPANTTYVAGTTLLNGAVVADASAGVSALQAGMLINAPENTTAGYLRADTDVAANNIATVTFDVSINLNTVIGTIISNQGFINGDGAGSGVFPQQPSDDPTTPLLVDDPTLDIVGNIPLVDVIKTVAIVNDIGTIGVVDQSETLRYTITASNSGAIPATGAVLTDAVPANTTYIANSTRLNGLAISDPAPNMSPLTGGIDISSSDLTPPLPTAGNGTLTQGYAAVITFDVLVDAAAVAGTIISNQGYVSNNELPTEPSDADGNDANGDQSTDVVVGNVQQLAITKQVFVVGGGIAQAGGQLEYVVRVTNIGGIAASNVVITDDLDLPVSAQMTYIAGSGLLNGVVTGVSASGSIITADYATIYGDLPAAGVAELRFRVTLSAGLPIGTNVLNTAQVSWNLPADTADASASIDIGGTPGSINLNGQVWQDANLNSTLDSNEPLLRDWLVQLYRNNTLLASTTSDVNGLFNFNGLPPNSPSGQVYQLRYVAPDAVSSSATLGQASSVFTNGPQRIDDIIAASGANLLNLNLPRQPDGVVYDSVLRQPVAGVRLTLVNQTRSNQEVPASCFDDPNQQDQITLNEGYYKFDLNFNDALRCAAGDDYVIEIQPPANGYVGTTSVIIPPVFPVTGAALNVSTCPGSSVDQIPATNQICEVSADANQQPTSVIAGTAATNYYLKFLLNDNTPFSDQAFNNHIAVDSQQPAAVAISKVAGLLNVTRSQLVPYTITISNSLPAQLSSLSVIDNFPAGFKYMARSARIDGLEVEPQINGRILTWTNLSLGLNETRVIKLLLIVGSGVGEGEYTNTAQVYNQLNNENYSGVASATVRVIPDPTFDCTDIIGKVYEDKNNNAYQDQGEPGIAGVDVATARGLRVTTDTHGRFHITCAVVPNEVRGSNFIMKVDDRTLPSGYRVTTENPRVQRATRGKMMKFNFGATIHRVVRLDLADGVFEKASTELRPQWRTRIDMLITELQKDPSVLRLSYLGENETEAEVNKRLTAIDALISKRWEQLDCCYKLTIEKEVFWRKGNPSDRKAFD